MLNCKQVTAVCSSEMERPLRWAEQLSLHTHLMMCTGCSNYRKQLKTLREVMQAYADGKAPPVVESRPDAPD
jgi:hypothetical protein